MAWTPEHGHHPKLLAFVSVDPAVADATPIYMYEARCCCGWVSTKFVYLKPS